MAMPEGSSPQQPAVQATPAAPVLERPGLRSLLLKALMRRLVLVLAPEGYGKTLALRDAIRHCGMPVAWIDLSTGERSIEVLARRILAETATVAGVPWDPSDHGEGPEDPVRSMAALVGHHFPSGLRVVLDGAEHSPLYDDVVALATEFLAANPPALGFAITGTAVPAIPLVEVARLGHLAVIGPHHLRFTADEIGESLRARWPGVDDEVINAVGDLTTGWPWGVMALTTSVSCMPTLEDLRDMETHAFVPPVAGPRLPNDPIDRELVMALSSLPFIRAVEADGLIGASGALRRLQELARAGTLVRRCGDDRFAVNEALRTRLRALSADVWNHERLMDHWARVGRILEGRDDVGGALQAYRRARDADGMARVLSRIGVLVLMDRDPGWTIALVEDLTRCRVAGHEAERLREFISLVNGAALEVDDPRSLPQRQGQPRVAWETMRALADALPDEASAWPRLWEAWLFLERGDLRGAAPLLRGMRRLYRGRPAGFHAGWALVCRARLHCARGEYGAARAALERVSPGRDEFLLLLRDRWVAEVDALGGSITAASDRIRHALRLARRLNAEALQRELWGLAAVCAVWRGDTEEARVLTARAEAEGLGSLRIEHARAMMSTRWPGEPLDATEPMETIAGDEWAPWGQLLRGELMLQRGRPAEALEIAAAVCDHAELHGAEHLKANAFLILAYAAKQRGDRGATERWLSRFWESAVAFGFSFMPVSDSDVVLWAGREAGSRPGPRIPSRRIIAAGPARESVSEATDTAIVPVEVMTLGRFGLRVAGELQESAWKSGRKAKRLFQFLLASPSLRVSVDAAAEILWPEGDPGKIMHSLHNETSNLRRVFRSAGIEGRVQVQAEYGFYRLYLSQDVRITDRAFEEAARRGLAAAATGSPDAARPLLEASVGMYAGAFLEDAPYESFAEVRRAELTHLASECLHALALHPGTTIEDAEKYWTKALELDPWDEAAYRGIAELCIRCGNLGKARLYLDEVRCKIVDELSVPMPQWARELETSLRA